MATPDADLAAEIDGSAYADQKVAALHAHRTQIEVDGPFFALSNHEGNEVLGIESFRIAKGTPVPGPDGLEHDLFAGTLTELHHRRPARSPARRPVPPSIFAWHARPGETTGPAPRARVAGSSWRSSSGSRSWPAARTPRRTLAASDKVPVGTQVAGVDIGGHDPARPSRCCATVSRRARTRRSRSSSTAAPSRSSVAGRAGRRLRRLGAQGRRRAQLATVAAVEYFTDGIDVRPRRHARPGPARRADPSASTSTMGGPRRTGPWSSAIRPSRCGHPGPG